MPGVGILLYGNNITLEALLKRVRKVDLKLNFFLTEVPYVGHLLTQDGLKPNPERLQAIIDMEVPSEKQAVQRSLGIIGYVKKFIPKLSEITKPLRALLSKDIAWHWDDEQERSFKSLKELLMKAPVLKYFDVRKPITMQVDASKSGLGAALFMQAIQCMEHQKHSTKLSKIMQ